MVRPSKSKEEEPPGNHTPNHHGYAGEKGREGRVVEAVDGDGGDGEGAGTPVTEQPPQLGIDDTAFVSTGQRSSVVSAGEAEGGKRGSVVELGGTDRGSVGGEVEGGQRGSAVETGSSAGIIVVSQLSHPYCVAMVMRI